eukprot:m51a1_g1709 hypothetical protein (366) ;mRNA; r:526721-527965
MGNELSPAVKEMAVEELVAACQRGDLPHVQSLCLTHPLTDDDVRALRPSPLHACAAAGSLAITQYLTARFALNPRDDREAAADALALACAGGHAELAQYLVQEYGLGASDVAGSGALRAACAMAPLGVAQWLADRFALPALPLGRACALDALAAASRAARPDAVRWLVEAFGLAGDELAPAVCEAAAAGDLELVRFLSGRAQLGDRTWLCSSRGPVARSLRAGRVDVAAWLADLHALAADDVRRACCVLLKAACAGGHVEAIAWAAKRFALGADDARLCGALLEAALSGRLEAVVCVEKTFGAAESDRGDVLAALRACTEDAKPAADIMAWLDRPSAHVGTPDPDPATPPAAQTESVLEHAVEHN